MSLREDTVVSNLPEFDPQQEDEHTSAAAPRARQRQAQRAVDALQQPVPPLPSEWGSARTLPRQPRLRVVPPPPDNIATIPAAPAHPAPGTPVHASGPLPPQPPPTPPRRPAGKAPPGIQPIPEPCFEPSVIQQIPQAPRGRPAPPPSIEDQPTPTALVRAQGKVVVMFSCRGGAGATTLTVNTAASLVRAGKSVCVLDLDMQLGDVFMALDLRPSTSIAALAREASTIDASALKRRLARHPSGVYALTQTGHVEDIDGDLVERIPALVSSLADHFDYVLVDGVRDFGDYALSVLDMADEICMVLTQDVASVRRAARSIQLFRRLGYGDTKLKLVLNRTTRKTRVDEGEVQRALGLTISARVRNDFKRMHNALNEGALIAEVAPSSGVAKDYANVARLLGGTGDDVGGHTDTSRVRKTWSLRDFLRLGGK